jgi:hypothetical protein
MATLQSHIPASLRSNSPSRRANPGNSNSEDSRPYLVAGRKGRTASTAFLALPKESEDAKITGATRSLDRRLLALNLRGTLNGTMNIQRSMLSITKLTEVRIA